MSNTKATQVFRRVQDASDSLAATDLMLLMRICTRAVYGGLLRPYAWSNFWMDLVACHVFACPLDLAKLAGADDFTFKHDLVGIDHHLDRHNLVLGEHFEPRCALASAPVPATVQPTKH